MRAALGLGLGVAAGALALLWLRPVRAFEPTLTLALLTTGVAASAVAWAHYRDKIVIGRAVRALRDPNRRADTIAKMRARVAAAYRSQSVGMIEDALRRALEPLVIVGFWDDVVAFAKLADLDVLRSAFARWLGGVHALAEMHRGDLDAAAAILARVEVTGSWLVAIDALRLALSDEPEDAQRAIDALEGLPPKRGIAADFQARLARVHALVTLGRTDEARALIAAARGEDQVFLDALVRLEGPASTLARSALAADVGDGPFRR